MKNQKIAVVGSGAVGCYFGGMLARAGSEVVFLRRPKTGGAGSAAKAPLYIDSIHFQENFPVEWTSDPAAVSAADVVLFCVKAIDNDTASKQIARHLKTGAIVVSLQNGVDNVERIRAASGMDALPSVVYVAAAMTAPDRVKHNGRGDLVIGEFSREKSERVRRVAELFEAAGVKCRVSDDISVDLWSKLMMNCAGNAVTTLGKASYGKVATHEPSRKVISDVIQECVAVARASGVHLPDADYVTAGIKLATGLGDATSSTAQDVARGKKTEIDSLNGYVARLGEKVGVPTPVNSTLHALVKLLEESAAAMK